LAKAIVNGWVGIPRGSARTASADPGFSFSSWKFIAPVLAALGIGTGAGAGIGTKSLLEPLKTLPVPVVSNRWELLGVVAVVGAVVGFAYSFYRNNWTIILPTFSRSQDQFKLASWGFLRNVLVAAVVSVATTWFAFSSAPKPASDGNLLNWTVLVSAIVTGLVGSRMASGEVEKQVLWEALTMSAEKPAVPGLARLVENAKTPLDAAALVTGQPVPGVKPPKEMSLVRLSAEIEANLLKNFDRPALKKWLVTRGTPLGKDGTGVPLGTLEQVQVFKSSLKVAIKDIEIQQVASMSSDAFRWELEKRGIEFASYKDSLDDVHNAAVRVKELLGSLPAGWSLTYDRI
jgi:hypothetical protein